MKNAIVNGKEIEEKAISDIIEELARIDRECTRTEAAAYLVEVSHDATRLAVQHALKAPAQELEEKIDWCDDPIHNLNEYED